MMKQLIDKFLYGGTKSLTPLEQTILYELSLKAPPAYGQSIRDQANKISRVQRENGNRMILVFFDSNFSPPPLLDLRESLLIGHIMFEVNALVIKARVVAHRGYLSSIELNKKISKSMLKMNPIIVEANFAIENHVDATAIQIDSEEHRADDSKRL